MSFDPGPGRGACWAVAAGLLCSLLAPQACVVYPHDAVKVPAVEGRLLLHGAPVPEATVRYSAGVTAVDCDPENGRALTDPDGYFRFEGERERAWIQLLPPFLCIYHRMICIDTAEGRRVEWMEGSRGLCRQPAKLDLVCDIAPDRTKEGSACVPADSYDPAAW
jgi:hypothetical protein